MRRFVARLFVSLRRSRAERELAREVTAHLQLLEDDFVAKGMTRDEARYAAKRAFGGVEQAKELQRDERAFRWLSGWPMDLKLGVRMLARTPGLTVIGVTALAIAIGAGAAYLEFTRDLLEPRLDLPGSDRLVGVTAWNAERRLDETFLVRDFDQWRTDSRQLEELGGTRPLDRHLTTPDGVTAAVRGAEISASAFRLLHAVPVMGRALTDDDQKPEAPPVAVISRALWQQRYAGAPGVLGMPARLGSREHTIVGVVPDAFAFPDNRNLWIPLKDTRIVYQIFGRLRDGATYAAAEAELGGMTSLSTELNARPAARIRVQSYLDSVMEPQHGAVEVTAMRALNLIFVMLLGICGANVATLVFARTAMREGEITVRTALGATRARIAAQLFAEALVLSMAAAVAGLFIARAVGLWIKDSWQQGIGPAPFWWDDGLSAPAVAYAFGLAIIAALIVGVVPALKATGTRLQGRLRDAASGTSTLKFGGMWTAIIVIQAAVTVAFLSAVVALGYAALRKSAGDDVLYSRDQLLLARLAGPEGARGAVGPELRAAVAERLRREPGVVNVSYATAVPGTIWEMMRLEFGDEPLQRHADGAKRTDHLWVSGARVGGAFFETIGIPLVAGRLLTDADVRTGAHVAIVDETFARVTLGGRNPIGVTIRERAVEGGAPGPWLEIVGVVKDMDRVLDRGVEDSVVYRPAPPDVPLHLLVRTQSDAARMTQSVYAAARSVDADLKLVDLMSAAQYVYDADLAARMFLRAFIVISAVALLLATAGIYALISFTLARRTREIGIRIALGAAPARILRGIFSRAARQIGLGVAAGMLPALVILESIAGDTGSMSFPAAMAAAMGIGIFVVAVALVSCAGPLRRALRVDPISALRSE